MSEWGVITVIIALIGLVTTVAKPLLNLNTSIVKLTSKLEGMTEDLHDLTERNAKSHDRMWKKLDEHETRINDLEGFHKGN